MTHEQEQQAQANFRRQKAALTRAKNTKDWTKIRAAAVNALASFDALQDQGIPWPDDWRLWERAKEDADFYIARGETRVA